MKELGILIISGEGRFGAGTINKDHVSFFQWTSEADLNRYTNCTSVTEGLLEKSVDGYKKELEEIGEDHMFYDSLKATLEQTKEVLALFKKENKTEKEQELFELTKDPFPIVYFLKDGTFDPNLVGAGGQITLTPMQQEFALKDGTNAENIPIILVPREKIPYVEDKLRQANLQTEVYPIEDHPAYSDFPQKAA